ncbi:MAG: hypothetical protein JWQ35_2266 [Bacteriovoracaceae bacterium]|nr:hypothetical protein [Bacteriovoracaceae bacterium]
MPKAKEPKSISSATSISGRKLPQKYEAPPITRRRKQVDVLLECLKYKHLEEVPYEDYEKTLPGRSGFL